ncbi:CIC11C00000003996 [Sungouiella intermedia]|uniref:CIC11C00000003996 n=1 Tax=Sungouiella intermedia TaxID=45354 RepID=A0A1L0C510_9ASCO|nr:CIC11C00000003996 [[Candida] intermedia]
MSSLPSSQVGPSETPETTPGPEETSPVVTTNAETTTQPSNGTAEAEDEIMDEVDETMMSLPLSKIKRIFKMDPDYFGSSASAVYATGVATELFVQYLTEHASMLAKMDKRKKIQYKDYSNAVSSQEALYFLSDTIPKTQTVELAIKERKINLTEEDKKKYGEDEAGDAEEVQAAPGSRPAPVLPKGQSSLPFEPVAKPTIKKAVIHDLMSNDDDVRENDAMIVD